MNLVFEGIDRVGKSSIIEALNDGTYSCRKMYAPDTVSRTFFSYLVYFDKLSTRTNTRPLIYDRGHLSELVYGSIYRQAHYRSNVLRQWFYYMEEYLLACENDFNSGPTVIVYVKPVNFELMQKDERHNANRERELAHYEYWLNVTKLPVVTIETQTQDTWKPMLEIITHLKEKLKNV